MSVPDYPLGQTLDFKFTSRAFATGVPTVLAGTPVIEVYEDNSVTQITVGETLTVDFDAVVGLNNLRIVATSGNGYEVGKSYQAIISTGTVGGTSVVGEVVAQFSIERSAALMPTVAGRTLDVTAGGTAGIDWANVEAQSTAVDLSATDIQLADSVTSVTTVQSLAAGSVNAAAIASNAIDADAIATDAITSTQIAASAIGIAEMASALVDLIGEQVWDTDATARQTLGSFGQAIGDPVANAKTLYAALVTDAVGASVTADVATVQADTDNIQTRLPAALVGGAMDSDVSAIQANAITAAAIATDAITAAKIAANAIGASELATDAIGSAQLATTAVDEIADGVWDEDATAHQTLGTFGQAIGDPVANAETIYEAVVTDAAGTNVAADIIAVQSDTDDIQTRLPAALVGGAMDADVSAIQNDAITAAAIAANAIGASELATDAIGSDQLAATAVQEIADAVLPATNTALSNIEFLMVDDTDHITPKTGLTVTGTRSIDGAAFTGVSGSIAEVGNGIYQFDAVAADMNGGIITFRFASATADDTFITIRTAL